MNPPVSKMRANSVRGYLSCRLCGHVLSQSFIDLGMSPLCESFVSEEDLNSSETFYPLHAYVCDHCFLVQLDTYVTPEHIFEEYAYFSSYADTWLEHSRLYVDRMIDQLALSLDTLVIEVASNDGYLLQYFSEQNVPVLGIEPAINVARIAIDKGIETRTIFFNSESAQSLVEEGLKADLLIGNNVLAQVPGLISFVKGLKLVLKPTGVLTLEFPHLMRLIDGNQFDTIYHEHFSYFSFITAHKIFEEHGLTLYDVEELSTHGGSLRIFLRHAEDATKPISERVPELLARERAAGYDNLKSYVGFEKKAQKTKRKLLEFLIGVKEEGKSVAGYGAPGKGNTLLNYCGIRTDFLEYTVDRNPYKQGKYLPGTRIPIHHPDKIKETHPDYVLILPWNFKDEIMAQSAYIRSWGGKFVVPIPDLTVHA